MLDHRVLRTYLLDTRESATDNIPVEIQKAKLFTQTNNFSIGIFTLTIADTPTLSNSMTNPFELVFFFQVLVG